MRKRKPLRRHREEKGREKTRKPEASEQRRRNADEGGEPAKRNGAHQTSSCCRNPALGDTAGRLERQYYRCGATGERLVRGLGGQGRRGAVGGAWWRRVPRREVGMRARAPRLPGRRWSRGRSRGGRRQRMLSCGKRLRQAEPAPRVLLLRWVRWPLRRRCRGGAGRRRRACGSGGAPRTGHAVDEDVALLERLVDESTTVLEVREEADGREVQDPDLRAVWLATPHGARGAGSERGAVGRPGAAGGGPRRAPAGGGGGAARRARLGEES